MIEPGKYTRPQAMIGFREDTTIASIVLYRNGKVKREDKTPDFLADLIEEVQHPISSIDNIAAQGNIPNLKLDGTNPYYAVFNNFIVTNVSESDKVISKVHMNFSDSWNVFFFGNSPKMISVEGGLIDTKEMPFYQEFMTAYEEYMSGTQLAKNNYRMILSYDGKIIDGYITDISVNTNSSSTGYKGFRMSILAKSVKWNRDNEVQNEANIKDTQMITNGLSNTARLVKDYSPDVVASNKEIVQYNEKKDGQ